MIVTTPEERPVTTPDTPTVAVVGELLDHTPPGVALNNVMEEPTQTDEGPAMADGAGDTVMGKVTKQPPIE